MPGKTENITLSVEGMTCSNCALGISRRLEKKGLKNIQVDFSTGEASFEMEDRQQLPGIIEDIHKLGYKAHLPEPEKKESRFSLLEKKFVLAALFTLPLLAHMFLKIPLFHNPLFQLALTIPVFIIGAFHFGKSAWASLKTGIPNMDVLITVGSSAAFIYSLAGTLLFFGTADVHRYLFYETSASIITLVLLGNVLEHRSVRQTTSALKELSELQADKAKKIVSRNGNEHIEETAINLIAPGDIVAVNSGDRVPADCILVSGGVSVDQSMVTGESMPADKSTGDTLTGGTIVISGNARLKVVKTGSETVLSQIIEMVKNARQSKPDIQRLGDKVSAIFVPVVLLIALGTFLVSAFLLSVPVPAALMNSIAVLVISCPCAMGLATPTAVMVGIGRAAKRGILIKGGQTLELLSTVKNIVFDKTGTLTTGEFEIRNTHIYNGSTEDEVFGIVFNLEKHSSHPIGRSLMHSLKEKAMYPVKFSSVREIRGMGMEAWDENGTQYRLGSFKIADQKTVPEKHDLYLYKNNVLIAGLDIKDKIKSSARAAIIRLKEEGIECILLSGDRADKCEEVARALGINRVYSEKLPGEKLQIIEELSAKHPTAMVGDGINDAPALEKATTGISLGNATQVAVQSAQVILLNENDLTKIDEAIRISRHTLITIKQNLFWAFFYNVLAIPVAAAGFLTPTIGALAMALSDVIVVGNSLRLKTKKIIPGLRGNTDI